MAEQAGANERSGARRKVRRGTVVSDAMDKTVVVAVVRTLPHPLYGKQISRRRRYYAHDEGNEFRAKTFYKSNSEGAFDPEGNVYPYDIDRLYGLVNEDRDFVILQYYVFDKVLRPLSYFEP